VVVFGLGVCAGRFVGAPGAAARLGQAPDPDGGEEFGCVILRRTTFQPHAGCKREPKTPGAIGVDGGFTGRIHGAGVQPIARIVHRH
jgi:hypothetical protein